MKPSRAEWDELRELAWEWDPIGVGDARQFTANEYECLMEQVVPLLQRGADASQIVAHFDEFLPEHFGLSPQRGAMQFAEKAIKWWRKIHRHELRDH
jgi:hypothetical protein